MLQSKRILRTRSQSISNISPRLTLEFHTRLYFCNITTVAHGCDIGRYARDPLIDRRR